MVCLTLHMHGYGGSMHMREGIKKHVIHFILIDKKQIL